VTKDKQKIPTPSPAQQAAALGGLPPEQAAVFKEIAAREREEVFKIKESEARSRGLQPPPHLQEVEPQPPLKKVGPQQTVIAHALRELRRRDNLDPAVETTAEIERRVGDFVEDKAKPKKVIRPSRATIERYLGRRKD
jgi:hypothetical protein